MKIKFLGTPDFIKPIKDTLARHFTMVDSLKEADLVVVAAYGKILTPEELNAPRYGYINVHPSLLPKYRGPSPIQAAILNEDKISGITIIKMDEQVDHGPILYQEEIKLSDRDNFDTLSKKMFLRAAEILPKIINKFVAGAIEDFAQDNKKATYCKILTRESGYFDLPAGRQVSTDFLHTLDRMIRAYYPWPGVWTRWKGRIVKFLPATNYPFGQTYNGRDKFVHDNQRRFLLQMEGKKAMPLQDFLNGYPDFPLKTL